MLSLNEATTVSWFRQHRSGALLYSLDLYSTHTQQTLLIMAVLIMVMFLMAVLALCSAYFILFFFCVAVFKAHLKAMLLFAATIDI